MNKNKKRIPWALVSFGVVSALNLIVILLAVIYAVFEKSFETNWLVENNLVTLIFSLTYILSLVFLAVHAVLLLWKNKKTSMLYIAGVASLQILYYVIAYALAVA